MSSDQRFFDFLKERIGLDVNSVGPAIIERAVRQRMTAQQVTTADEYWLRLQVSADEQQALIEGVIVPETWFFRYPESFATLARLALKRLAEIKGMRALRILSLPCSTGEEPYSIAMALFDAGLAAASIHGRRRWMSARCRSTGPSARCTARIRFVVSTSISAIGISRTEDDGHRVSDRVREQVRLQIGNLLDPTLLASEPAYDFVFCRNLLIYFDQPTQQQVLAAAQASDPRGRRAVYRPGRRQFAGPPGHAFDWYPAILRLQPSLRAEPAPPPVFIHRRCRLRDCMPTPRPVRSRPFAVARRPAPRRARKHRCRARRACCAALQPWPTKVKASKRGPPARATCAITSRWRRCFTGWGCSVMSPATCWRPRGFIARRCTCDPQHPEALMHLSVLLASQGDASGARRLQERAARMSAPLTVSVNDDRF